MAGGSLGEFLRSEVADWDDDMITAARFKAFTGQRQDWESRYQFWKHLIVCVARHLDIIIIDADEVQQTWFNRNGLLPLGVTTVLIEMLRSGDLQKTEEFMSQDASNIRWAFAKLASAVMWAGRTTIGMSETAGINLKNQRFIVSELLKERTEEVVKALSDSQWSTTAIVTSLRFAELCGGLKAARVVQQNLLLCKRAQRLEIEGDDKIEGLKISLNQGPVSKSTEHDLHLLQLYWTKDKIEQQIIFLDSQVSTSQSAAAAAARSGDRQRALRHLRCMKIASASRETCAGFGQRISEVLAVISDAETTKKVTDAMRVGASAIKEHHVTLEELHECLDDVAESVSQQNQLEEALAGHSHTVIDADGAEFEHELAALEAELHNELVLETPAQIKPGDAESLPSAHVNSAASQADQITSNVVQETETVDFERELAELEADLASSPDGWLEGDQECTSQIPSRPGADPRKNPGVTFRRGSLGATEAGDIRHKESEKLEEEFSKLRVQLEPA